METETAFVHYSVMVVSKVASKFLRTKNARLL